MPSFIFAEFEQLLDWGEVKDAALVENLYRYRDALEQILMAHGCAWTKTQGKRLLAVFENDQALFAIYEAAEKLAALTENAPAPVKMVAHTGEAFQGQSGWFGYHVEHAHRILDAAPSGYPLISSSAAQALPVPPGCHRMSVGVHLLGDLWEPEELFTLFPEGRLRVEFPIPRSLGAYKHNLPYQPTPFLGRKEELHDLARRLAEPGTRLITLLGPGGFGKTRLALQLAADHVGRYEGVHWLPLAPLVSEDRMFAVLASALGLVFYTDEDPMSKILSALQNKRVLLVFDNFEHLPGGRVFVEKLLEIPTLQIVVTSRESLRHPLEQVVPIGGLQYPEYEGAAAFEESGAFQLFFLHLRKTGRTSGFDEPERRAFLELCRLLHGMPLGLEMAASLTVEHTLAEVVEEVRAHVDLLTSALPHLPDRQKSVRAVFEYSWKLLNPAQARTLARLSVLRTAFDLRAARRVGDCESEDLQQLVNRSLLMSLPGGMFQLHEIVRYYAKERLYENPRERYMAQSTHARYFLAFIRSRYVLFHGKDQRVHLEQVSSVLEDISAAFDWSMEQGRLEWITRSLESYGLFFERKARFQEGREAFNRMLGALLEAGAINDDLRDVAILHARLLAWKVFLGVRIGSVEGMAEDLETILKLLGPTGKRQDRAFAALLQGQWHELKGEGVEALSKYRKAIALYKEVGDPRGISMARNRLSQTVLTQGNAEEARREAADSLEYYERQEDPSGMAWSHVLLGEVAFHQLRFEEARRHYRQALEGYLAVGNRDGVGWTMILLGSLAKTLGELPAAEQMFREALSIEEELLNNAAQAWIHQHLGETAWFQSRYSDALVEFQKCLDLYRAIDDRRGIVRTLHCLGKTEITRNNADAAEVHFLAAGETLRLVRDSTLRAWHGFYLASLDHLRGDETSAGNRLRVILRLFEKEHDILGTGWTAHFLGEIALSRGKIDRAEAAFRKSLLLAREHGVKPMILECWLGWAQVQAARGRILEALEWVEAVLQQNNISGVTFRKAEPLRDQWARSVSAEERAFARVNAAAADLGLWSTRILDSRGGKTRKTKTSSLKRKAAPRVRRRKQ